MTVILELNVCKVLGYKAIFCKEPKFHVFKVIRWFWVPGLWGKMWETSLFVMIFLHIILLKNVMLCNLTQGVAFLFFHDALAVLYSKPEQQPQPPSQSERAPCLQPKRQRAHSQGHFQNHSAVPLLWACTSVERLRCACEAGCFWRKFFRAFSSLHGRIFCTALAHAGSCPTRSNQPRTECSSPESREKKTPKEINTLIIE